MKEHSMHRNKVIRLGITYFILILMTLIVLYPLAWTVGASFNPGNSLVSTTLIPKNPTFAHYIALTQTTATFHYFSWFWNSIKISIATMVLSVIFVSMTAYAFSRFHFVGRKNGLTMFLLLQMIPQFSALIAIFVLAQMLGLVNSHLLLILIYTGGQIPMSTYLMKGYFDSIPQDLDESARIDGASNTRIFLQILMPLARPMVAVVAMNGFTGPLGDFAISSVILRDPKAYTLPIGLYNLITEKMGASYTTFAAGAILISVPVAIVFLMLQRNFVTGLTEGGTKG
ncbi:sugar ABC transporter permease [Lacticaseibacillus mingshuiensis]|uniref:Sugar ABC transporter permease n=1 Tax=Lacticaseibacillus mingshuiensis TaxID=2799574 RepID=A0ABW4CDM4_9LACO|nr:sugar ABC transporter permease [Lacticaseibacillus mingshuiensis]